jgi:outer membrane protein assembly factor BamB
MNTITICIIGLIASVNADLLVDLPADQESIYVNISYDLIPFEEYYPELLWVKSAFWPGIIGYSEDCVFCSGVNRWHSSEISILFADGSEEVLHIVPGWQHDYYAAMQDDTLYAISTGDDHLSMDLYTVSISTGDILRSLYMPAPATSSPILIDDMVIVSLLDGNLIALKQDTVVWGYTLNSLSTGPMLLHDSILLFGTNSSYTEPGHHLEWYSKYLVSERDFRINEPSFFALDPENGELLWRTHLTDHVAGPTSIVDGTIFASLDDGSIIALDIESGDLRWQEHDCVGEFGRFGISEDYLLCSSDKGTRCLDPTDGREIWSSDLVSCDGSAGVWKDIVFILDGLILVALDGNTGDKLWHFNRGWSNGEILVHGDLIYTTSQRHVFCLEMKPID